jgi:hypothetical protein
MSMCRISSICHPPQKVISFAPRADVDLPFEPIDHESIDWDLFGGMTQDIASYFVKEDDSGKTDMDYFVEGKMNFGKDDELPVAPDPVKVVKSGKTNIAAKRWQPKTQSTAKSAGKSLPSKPLVRARRSSTRPGLTSAQPRREKIVREDLRDEVSELERQELAECANDDFGITFDLEL